MSDPQRQPAIGSRQAAAVQTNKIHPGMFEACEAFADQISSMSHDPAHWGHAVAVVADLLIVDHAIPDGNLARARNMLRKLRDGAILSLRWVEIQLDREEPSGRR